MTCLCCAKHCGHGKTMSEHCVPCEMMMRLEERKDNRIKELEALLKELQNK